MPVALAHVTDAPLALAFAEPDACSVGRPAQAILRKHVDAPVVVAADGLEGVEAAQREFFDVVLMVSS